MLLLCKREEKKRQASERENRQTICWVLGSEKEETPLFSAQIHHICLVSLSLLSLFLPFRTNGQRREKETNQSKIDLRRPRCAICARTDIPKCLCTKEAFCFVLFLSTTTATEREAEEKKHLITPKENPARNARQMNVLCFFVVFFFGLGEDTRPGMPRHWLPGRNVRSKVWWFTELCNSHYVSQFAAFFIVTRAERSTVESRQSFVIGHKHTTLFFSQSLSLARERERTRKKGSVLFFASLGSWFFFKWLFVQFKNKSVVERTKKSVALSLSLSKGEKKKERHQLFLGFVCFPFLSLSLSLKERERERKRKGSQSERVCFVITLMIPPQVHLRRPCYDFSFL